MKLLLVLFSAICLLPIISKAQQTADTVVFNCPNEICGYGLFYWKGSGKTKAWVVDSIFIDHYSIVEDSTLFYLKAYSKDGHIRLEGLFFHTMSAGKLVRYDEQGRKVFEGENQIIEPSEKYRYFRVEATGTNTWYFYKNQRTQSPTKINTITYEKDSRKYSSVSYDGKGKVIREEEGKRKSLYR